MKIDGYTPADTEIATEIGVEFDYDVTVGDNAYKFNFRAKSSGSENKAFQVAAEKLNMRREIRLKTKFKQSSEAGLKEMLEIWFDHIIISWSTNVKSEGKVVKATRETFIELLSMEPFVGVILQLQTDCGDSALFVKEAEAEAAKN